LPLEEGSTSERKKDVSAGLRREKSPEIGLREETEKDNMAIIGCTDTSEVVHGPSQPKPILNFRVDQQTQSARESKVQMEIGI
jgi:hypothetical protein